MSMISHVDFKLPAQRWLIAGLVCVFAVILVQYTLKTRHSESGTRSAFLRWRGQLEELDDGVNVWEKFAYPNPPIMAMILKPFMLLPPALGASTWFLVKAVLALAAILGACTLLDSPERPFPLWGKALAALLTLRPIEGDLVHGNVNLLILFLIVATLIAYCQRHDSLAGLLLGLSIACKLTPALFLVYFLYKRAWTTLLASAISLVSFVLIVPGVYFGWQNNLDYHHSWHRQMVAPYAAGVVTSEHKNQSLPGLLHRLLSDEASFSDYVGDRKIVLETHNLVSWDGRVVQGITIVCMGLFGLAAMFYCRASSAIRPRLQIMAEFSVVVLGMLLFCERTWKHHCVTLLLPFMVLACCLSSTLGKGFPTPSPPTPLPLSTGGEGRRSSRWLRCYLALTLAAVAVLMLSTSTGVLDRDTDTADRFGKMAQVYGAYVWAFLLLLASMFVILRGRRNDPSQEFEERS